MSGQFCHSLLVHSAVEQSGNKVMPQGVEMICLRKSKFLINFAEMFGEGIWMNQLARLVCKQIVRQLKSRLFCFHHFLCAIRLEITCDCGTDYNRPNTPVFSRSLHSSLSWNDTAGASDGQNRGMCHIIHQEVIPFESTQLSPPASCVNCQNIVCPVFDFLIADGIQEAGNFLWGWDYLHRSVCARKIDHSGRILINNRIALGVAEDCGNHGQVLLDRGLLDRFSVVLPLRSSTSICSRAIGRRLHRRIWPMKG